MITRIKHSYQAYIDEFLKDIFVQCPNCCRQAIVRSKGDLYKLATQEPVKFTCLNCGSNKILRHSRSVLYSARPRVAPGEYILIGAAVDPFFHLPLWLATRCGDETLWAYNYEHLAFIRLHVEAKLRERNGIEPNNRSLGSRLPAWITSRRNRSLILRTIESLERKK